MLRFIAAFLVLAGHLRAYIFQDYGEVGDVSSGVLLKAFYFFTGLGHQAVIVFFALSGFLVGGKSIDAILEGRFSWPQYWLRRLSRLWIVVVPALLATLLFDKLGIWLTDGAGYAGAYRNIYSSGPNNLEPLSHDVVTFLGNILFLQNIEVPVFGTNGPMWSLSNEFWYYALFPLFLWVFMPHVGFRWRLLAGFIFVALMQWLPSFLLSGGVIWAAGALAAWIGRKGPLVFFRHTCTRFGALAVLVGAIAASRIAQGGTSDVLLGLCVCLTLPVLAEMPNASGVYRAVARGGSEVSYSLYLSHFPILTLLVMVGISPSQYVFGATGAFVYSCLLCVAVAWGGLFWWCFERHTDSVFTFLRRRLLRG